FTHAPPAGHVPPHYVLMLLHLLLICMCFYLSEVSSKVQMFCLLLLCQHWHRSQHGRQAGRAESDAAAPDQIALTTLKPIDCSRGSPVRRKPGSRAAPTSPFTSRQASPFTRGRSPAAHGMPASPFASRHVSPFTREARSPTHGTPTSPHASSRHGSPFTRGARSPAHEPGDSRPTSCSGVGHASGSSAGGHSRRAASQMPSNSVGTEGEAGRRVRQEQLQGYGSGGAAGALSGSEHGSGVFVGSAVARDGSDRVSSRSSASGRGERGNTGHSSAGISGGGEAVGGRTQSVQNLDSNERKGPLSSAQRVSVFAAAASNGVQAPPAPPPGDAADS
ncbi:hypothetical protein DUNSADRAFT_4289, partial [Dunaliella salina]